jgi:hypothetical protein
MTGLTFISQIPDPKSRHAIHRVFRVFLEMFGPIRHYLTTLETSRSRDSVVGMATSYGLDDRGVGIRVPVGSRIFSFPNRPDRLWDPPNLLCNEYRGLLYPGVKRPGREVDHSPPTSAEVKKMWIYTSTSHTPSWRSAVVHKLFRVAAPFFN